MVNLIIEGGNYFWAFVLVLSIMFGIPLLLIIIGLIIKSKHKKTAKVVFIIAVIYLIVSLGICGSMM